MEGTEELPHGLQSLQGRSGAFRVAFSFACGTTAALVLAEAVVIGLDSEYNGTGNMSAEKEEVNIAWDYTRSGCTWSPIPAEFTR